MHDILCGPVSNPAYRISRYSLRTDSAVCSPQPHSYCLTGRPRRLGRGASLFILFGQLIKNLPTFEELKGTLQLIIGRFPLLDLFLL
jgi:hypothetical protein